MSIIKSVLIVLLLLTPAGYVSKNYQNIKESIYHKIYNKPAIARILYNGYSGCSAVVVSDKVAISALHCFAEIKDTDIIELSSDDYELKVNVLPFYTHSRRDLVFLAGDFSNFNKLKINPNGFSINQEVKACGFPYGGRLICSKTTVAGQYGLMAIGKGFVYPGMSGGPVIDLKNNEVYGINYGFTSGYNILNPLIGVEQ